MTPGGSRSRATTAGRRRTGGFTLIELLVALALVALLASAAVVGIGALTGTRARSAVGELGGTVRSLYDTAALTGHTCRLVFEMPERDGDGETRVRAECAPGSVTTALDRDQALREEGKGGPARPRRSATPADPTGSAVGTSLQDALAAERDRVEAAATYAAFTSPEVQTRALRGVRVSVWTQHQQKPAASGLAYLYFFPQGFTERAQVTVSQGRNAWTLTVAPLTGKTAVVDGVLEVPRS